MSPAQKITAAFNDRHELCGPFDDNWQELCLAAAFREAADAVVPECATRPPWTHVEQIRRELLAIAAELENLQS
jgi:hypothetical protein